MRHLTYEARLQQLCLTRLELRRLHLNLLFCYRIVFGLVSVKCEDFFEFASVMTLEDMRINYTSLDALVLFVTISSLSVLLMSGIICH